MQIAHTGTTPNNYQYSGEWLDSNVGLYYLRARYFNQATGRFWSRDPADGKRCCSMSLNPYLYVLDNPVNTSDPTGRDFIETFFEYDADEVLAVMLRQTMSKAAAAFICTDIAALWAVQNPDATYQEILLYEAYCFARLGG